MKEIKNKVVILRSGLNVPVKKNFNIDKKDKNAKKFIIEDDFRILKSLETIDYLLENNNKVIIISHIGRDKKNTLRAVFDWLSEYYNKNNNDDAVKKIFFDNKTFLDLENKTKKEIDKKFLKLKEKIEKINFGQILLLDNIRATTFEKENNSQIAKKIKEISDFYVNDAFSVSHRKYLSMDALPREFKKENKDFGLLFKKEIKNLNKCFDPTKNSKENFDKKNKEKNKKSIFVLGGAKLKTKTVLMKSFLDKYDKIIVGGVLANTFYKNLGFEIGKSKFEELDENIDFDFKKISENKNFFLPNIVIVQNRNGKFLEKEISNVTKNDIILDISPSAFFEVEDELKDAGFVLFNGPLGYYEKGFTDGTEYLLNIFNSKNNFFVAGGGNTVSLIRKLGLSENADFLSTGGGAMIDYLKDKKLPGIDAVLE